MLQRKQIDVPCHPEVAKGPLGLAAGFIADRSLLLKVENLMERESRQTGTASSRYCGKVIKVEEEPEEYKLTSHALAFLEDFGFSE